MDQLGNFFWTSLSFFFVERKKKKVKHFHDRQRKTIKKQWKLQYNFYVGLGENSV